MSLDHMERATFPTPGSEGPHGHHARKGRTCMGVDVGISMIGTPPRKCDRINFYPDHLQAEAHSLFFGLFRTDAPFEESVGQFRGIFKNR